MRSFVTLVGTALVGAGLWFAGVVVGWYRACFDVGWRMACVHQPGGLWLPFPDVPAVALGGFLLSALALSVRRTVSLAGAVVGSSALALLVRGALWIGHAPRTGSESVTLVDTWIPTLSVAPGIAVSLLGCVLFLLAFGRLRSGWRDRNVPSSRERQSAIVAAC